MQDSDHPTTPGPAMLWVEISATSPLITGVVHREKSSDVGFEGWLELMSLLSAKVTPMTD